MYIDKSLTWDTHVHWVCDRLSQRLYFLRRLWFYGLNSKIILLFYQSVLEIVIRYGLSTWYKNLNVKSKTKIQGIVRTAMTLTGQKDYPSIQSLFEQCVLKEAKRILSDPSHVLFSSYELLPSGRRYRIPRCKLNRFNNSFVPVSIRLLNLEQWVEQFFKSAFWAGVYGCLCLLYA